MYPRLLSLRQPIRKGHSSLIPPLQREKLSRSFSCHRQHFSPSSRRPSYTYLIPIQSLISPPRGEPTNQNTVWDFHPAHSSVSQPTSSLAPDRESFKTSHQPHQHTCRDPPGLAIISHPAPLTERTPNSGARHTRLGAFRTTAITTPSETRCLLEILRDFALKITRDVR